MLFLQPPYLNIDGVTIFSDHADELQKYYLPAAPHITMRSEGAAGIKVPQITLLKYRGNAGTGGFLNFDVNLGIQDQRLDRIRKKLKQTLDLDDEPRLAPVPLVDGNVRLLMLGKSTEVDGDGQVDDGTGDAADDPDTDRPQFVLKIDHHAKPSLYGDNQAVFSVELDESGVQLIEDSMGGAVLPVGVVYSLEFYALRPAYNVNITADWNRVQTHFEETFGVSAPILNIQISEIIDKLVEDQVIEITVDTFIPEDEDDIGFAGRRDRALNDFKDAVLKTFFEPSLLPPEPDADDSNDFVKSVEQLSELASTGGIGQASFNYKRVDMTRIDQKMMNFNMSERTAVRREIYPQAHLSGLTEILKDAQGNLDMSRFVREVTLDDEWFEQRELRARALLDFQADSVDSVNLTLTYDQRPKTILLTQSGSDAPVQEVKWNSLLANGRMVRGVDYQYTVQFKGVNTAERPGIIVSQPAASIGEVLTINPRGEELYFIDDIQIAAHEKFPWEEYPVIEIHLKYDDPDHEIQLQENYLLKSTNAEITWRRFRLDKSLRNYQLKIIFRGADHQDRELDWKSLENERYTIANPRPAQRSVQVMPAVSWDKVAFIFVELSYEDRVNAVFKKASLSFD